MVCKLISKNGQIEKIMKKIYIQLFVAIMLITACDDEWLDIKQNKKQVVPQKLHELQALLDYTNVMNFNGLAIGEMGTDDIYLTPDRWETRSPQPKNAYIWASDIYAGEEVPEWDVNYQKIFYANTVLDGLEKIEESPEKDHVKGRALFHRAWNHFHLAVIFGQPYNEATSTNDLSIPLRLTSNINVPVIRNTVKETYNSILADATEAAELLPEQSNEKMRPDKVAAYGLLARIYLQLEDYDQALAYSDAALGLYDELLDYNTINTGAAYPLISNKEVVYQSMMARFSPIGSYSYLFASEELYSSYIDSDLRKAAFFRKDDGSGFKGSYSLLGIYFFNGLATDELYLIKAESLARQNEGEESMSILNELLVNRHKTNEFEPLVATDAEEALSIILMERRKELLFRGIRWMDLRRLNKDPRFAKTITRDINGEQYELLANSPKYVYPIPDIVIEMSGVRQNER